MLDQLNLKHYKIKLSDDGYYIVNNHTGITEYSNAMLPSIISTAEALDKALESILDEYQITL